MKIDAFSVGRADDGNTHITIFLRDGEVSAEILTEDGSVFMSGDFLPVQIEKWYLSLLEQWIKAKVNGR